MDNIDYMSLETYKELFCRNFNLKKVSLAVIARETATNYQILRNLKTRPQLVSFDMQLMVERLFYLDAKVRGWV